MRLEKTKQPPMPAPPVCLAESRLWRFSHSNRRRKRIDRTKPHARRLLFKCSIAHPFAGTRPPRMREQIVAVVDDDPGMLKSIERLLKAYKYQTATSRRPKRFSTTPRRARQPASSSIFIWAGCRELTCGAGLTASGSRLPVIFISAVDDESVHEEALAAGCVAYLRKPFLAHLLIGAINKAVQ